MGGEVFLGETSHSRQRGMEIGTWYNFASVLYGCETWSLTLREERKLRLLRIIFGPSRDEVTVEWRRLHNGS